VIQDLYIGNAEFLVAEACQMSHLGKTGQSRVIKAKDKSLVLQLQKKIPILYL